MDFHGQPYDNKGKIADAICQRLIEAESLLRALGAPPLITEELAKEVRHVVKLVRPLGEQWKREQDARTD